MKNWFVVFSTSLIFMIVSATISCAVDGDLSGVKDTDKVKVASTRVTAKPAADVSEADTKTVSNGLLVDINTAAEADLKRVPGIGNAYAAKIIAGRPYANKAQLKSRKILPGVVYEQIKDLIIAKQPKKVTTPEKRK